MPPGEQIRFHLVVNVVNISDRSTLDMTDSNTAHKRKNRFRLYRIIKDDFPKTVTTKWKPALSEHNLPATSI